MKKISMIVAALALLGSASAQQTTIKSRSTLTVASSANMEKVPPRSGLNRSDAAWLRAAAVANRAEIKLGQLAQQRGADWGKEYGKDMEREHSLGLEEVKKVAQAKGSTLPSDIDAEHRALYARLSRLSGASFDAAYRAAMLKAHAKVLAKIQEEIRNGRDSMVRGCAVVMETAVKMHLKMAQERMTMMMGKG